MYVHVDVKKLINMQMYTKCKYFIQLHRLQMINDRDYRTNS